MVEFFFYNEDILTVPFGPTKSALLRGGVVIPRVLP